MNKISENANQSNLKQVRFYVKHGLQMIQHFQEFYKSLDELSEGFERLDKSSGRVLVFFSAKELSDSLKGNNPQEIETLLHRFGGKKHFQDGEARYELLDILRCFNNVFQTILKI
jgi:hypothetical protein